MVGLHRVNLAEVKKLDELNPRKPSKEQCGELIEDLVEVLLFDGRAEQDLQDLLGIIKVAQG